MFAHSLQLGGPRADLRARIAFAAVSMDRCARPEDGFVFLVLVLVLVLFLVLVLVLFLVLVLVLVLVLGLVLILVLVLPLFSGMILARNVRAQERYHFLVDVTYVTYAM